MISNFGKKRKYKKSKTWFKFKDTLKNNVEAMPVYNKDDVNGKQN